MNSIRFFGTSAGVPTADRNVSSLVLKLENKNMFMVDCGDGTAYQLIRSKEKINRITVIFITHMHSDHILGLPGLISCLANDITIVGPVGIRAFVENANAAISKDSRIHNKIITFIELEPEKSYPTIPFDKETKAKFSNINVGAYPLSHICPCFGYIFSELEDAMRLDSKKAMELGARGPELGRLSKGEDVIPAAGGPLIRHQDVLMIGRRRRKVAIFGDTNAAHLKQETVEAARGCDALVHESTYVTDDDGKTEKFMHSTVDMVCEFVKSAEIKKVYLNHISPSVKTEDLVEKAVALFGDIATVAVDLQEHKI